MGQGEKRKQRRKTEETKRECKKASETHTKKQEHKEDGRNRRKTLHANSLWKERAREVSTANGCILNQRNIISP